MCHFCRCLSENWWLKGKLSHRTADLKDFSLCSAIAHYVIVAAAVNVLTKAIYSSNAASAALIPHVKSDGAFLRRTCSTRHHVAVSFQLASHSISASSSVRFDFRDIDW